ncbi:MAG: Dabb family protein [Acidobacteria bacterium]|nr:Dabb family protein [Acidobacteriota bacterium]
MTYAEYARAGAAQSGAPAAQNKFATPSTIIHISLIKWKDGVSDADKQKALDGVKNMAAKIPGIKNVWLKATRMQPRDYHAAFVIEFENRAAAEAYAEHPAHAEWSKFFLSIREASISPQISN